MTTSVTAVTANNCIMTEIALSLHSPVSCRQKTVSQRICHTNDRPKSLSTHPRRQALVVSFYLAISKSLRIRIRPTSMRSETPICLTTYCYNIPQEGPIIRKWIQAVAVSSARRSSQLLILFFFLSNTWSAASLLPPKQRLALSFIFFTAQRISWFVSESTISW